MSDALQDLKSFVSVSVYMLLLEYTTYLMHICTHIQPGFLQKCKRYDGMDMSHRSHIPLKHELAICCITLLNNKKRKFAAQNIYMKHCTDIIGACHSK